ncbi:transcriptional repressor [Nitrospira sp.]|nr:transcriptional repressor [Nitrospira sp.]
MRVTQDEIRRRFRRRGLRVTPQRVAIYEALVNTALHPTAEQLLASVRRRLPDVSVNTVYYTLGALREADLVHEVNYGHESARFDGNVEPHHHLVCRTCRRIFDVHDEALDRIPLEAAEPSHFAVTGHRVEIYGHCAACRARSELKHGCDDTNRIHHRPTRR